MSNKLKVQVYLDDGRIFEYEVDTMAKAREHTSAIIKTGYRHNPGSGYMEHYPPHRLLKVKVVGDIKTQYPDKVLGT